LFKEKPKRLTRHLSRNQEEVALSELRHHEKKERKAQSPYFSPISRLQALGNEGGRETMLPQVKERILEPSLL
jgi:hypothetical protein